MSDRDPGQEGGETPGHGGAGSAGRAGGGRPAGPDAGPPVPSSELERVIHRAVQLQHGAAGEGDGGEAGAEALSESEVLRIGREVGLEPRHVRRALAEVRAEALLPEAPDDEGLPRRLLGDAFVRASRAIPGEPDEVQERTEEHFRERESLQSVRRRAGRSLWEPAGSLVSKMQRALDVGGHGYELAEGRRVELSVAGLEDGWSLVTLTVDLRNVRSEHGIGWISGLAGAGSGAGVVAVLVLGVPALVAVPALAAAAVGGTSAATRWTLQKKRRRLELVLEGLLDRLEHGEELEPRRPDWRERLLG